MYDDIAWECFACKNLKVQSSTTSFTDFQEAKNIKPFPLCVVLTKQLFVF